MGREKTSMRGEWIDSIFLVSHETEIIEKKLSLNLFNLSGLGMNDAVVVGVG